MLRVCRLNVRRLARLARAEDVLGGFGDMVGVGEGESVLSEGLTTGGEQPRVDKSQAQRVDQNPVGLQVVENWNSANTVVFYGKDSALTGADREHAEVSMLALHLLQSAMAHINTLLL